MSKSNMNHRNPPAHLSERAKTLWLALVPKQAKGPARLALLQSGLEALDRADAAREAIALAGMVTTTAATGAMHIHPLVKVERESRQLFMAAWKALNLQWDND